MQKYRLFLRYLLYKLTSKTKYKIHSPFIYKLVTEVINTKVYYKISKKFTNKKTDLLIKIINYFSIKSILKFDENDKSKLESFTKYCAHTIIDDILNFNDIKVSHIKSYYDMCLIDLSTQQNNSKIIEFCLNLTGNNSIMILENLYTNKHTEKIWKKLIKTARVKVSVDLFLIGIIFFRKEQAKENFIVRF